MSVEASVDGKSNVDARPRNLRDELLQLDAALIALRKKMFSSIFSQHAHFFDKDTPRRGLETDMKGISDEVWGILNDGNEIQVEDVDRLKLGYSLAVIQKDVQKVRAKSPYLNLIGSLQIERFELGIDLAKQAIISGDIRSPVYAGLDAEGLTKKLEEEVETLGHRSRDGVKTTITFLGVAIPVLGVFAYELGKSLKDDEG